MGPHLEYIELSYPVLFEKEENFFFHSPQWAQEHAGFLNSLLRRFCEFKCNIFLGTFFTSFPWPKLTFFSHRLSVEEFPRLQEEARAQPVVIVFLVAASRVIDLLRGPLKSSSFDVFLLTFTFQRSG